MRVRSAVVGFALVGFCLLGSAQPVAAQAAADPGVGAQSWWYTSLDLAAAHRISTGRGVTVAVIDTPVDPTIPDLQGSRVLPTANECAGGPTGASPAVEHGTNMVTWIVGNGRGNGPGGTGVPGVAPDATVRTYAISDSSATKRTETYPCTGNSGYAAADALNAAVADGARIVSMSFADQQWDIRMNAAVTRALDAGVVLVASVGNDPHSSVEFPAAIPGVVAVASTGRDGRASDFNPGKDRKAFVIAAPGEGMTAGGFYDGKWQSQGFVTAGTSDSTAVVAGALALVAAKYPTATGDQLIQDLIHNPAGNRSFGRTADEGYGLLDPDKMLSVDPTTYPDVNPLLQDATTATPSVASAPAGQPQPVAAQPLTPAAHVLAETPTSPAAELRWPICLVVAAAVATAGTAWSNRRSNSAWHTALPDRRERTGRPSA